MIVSVYYIERYDFQNILQGGSVNFGLMVQHVAVSVQWSVWSYFLMYVIDQEYMKELNSFIVNSCMQT